VKEFGFDRAHSFTGHGQKVDLEIEQLRREVNSELSGYPKKPSRAVARLCAVETARAILAAWRVAAVSLLEALSPLKNVVHGCMRT
jgi:hypothetical protein